MTLISKTAGTLSLISCVHDIHKTALIYSRNEYAKTAANALVSTSVNNQKADNISYKDAQRKNWLTQQNYFASIKEGFARVKGYIKGALKTSLRYLPNFALAAVALLAGKNCKSVKKALEVANTTKTAEAIAKAAKATKAAETIANVAAVGLGIIEGVDFVKNTLGVNQRDDYLDIK